LTTSRRRVTDRIAFRLSRSTYFDGLWVGCFFVDRSSEAFGRIEDALRLIKAHDPVRYRRVLRDLDRVWVTLLPGSLGRFRNAFKSCDLDERFVLAETTSPEEIAAAIVHEATHARLLHCGIGYEPELRARVETICFRRELAFAAKLPDGKRARADAEARLTGYAPDYWTNQAFGDRFDQGSADALRFLGVPEFLIRAAFAVRALLWSPLFLYRRLSRWSAH